MASSDEKFMRLALELAAKAKGRTRPNPQVGAVVVRSGRIVGTGWHKRAGLPHAEVIAIRRAGRKARGATLYVTLEPCVHTGRTGPCTELIKKAGIRRVVAAMIDPNPKVAGKGIRALKAAGIKVSTGLLESQARFLNEIFVTWMKKKRPFVTVKIAQSLDGKIAARSGDSRWISSPASREWVHHLRAGTDAILVGVETVLKDDPRLTVRLNGGGKQPVKIVLDSRLRTSAKARIFTSKAPVIIATTSAASKEKEKKLQHAGAQVIRFPAQKGRVPLKPLLRRLAAMEISHLLIEGGGEVIASAFQARAVDRIFCLIAPTIIGGRSAPTSVGGEGIPSLKRAYALEKMTVRPLGPDLLVAAQVSC
ncbi:MAG: bifunctional diaminohydroxyphosphoribosylaminopyrimidine deaminase/5-amino-6-(5-phosphoribosylamino)uracil reductase RibD [Candidatus Omnitrophica bacterium]|nr:bifunctional diaminohydroxyphosphoribosylaminopyrimidine deaminase/5-amino-6-(5-phosphoribosylamino)uracil reductase RibD [Candidatus Omnitrophota bacterium]